MTDLYAFIGTLIAGIVIMVTGFDRADAIASLPVAVLMLRSDFDLQRKAIRVLLESTPAGMPPAVGIAMAQSQHVKEHVWELAPGHSILRAHVLVAHDVECHAIRREIERMLKERFKIAHTTLQVDHAPVQLLSGQRHGIWPSRTT